MTRLLVACVVALVVAAPAGGGRPRKMVFSARLSGEISVAWSLERAYVEQGCTWSARTTCGTTVGFRSTRPSRVRGVTYRLRALRGSVTPQYGPSRSDSEDCRTSVIGDPPPPSAVPFVGGEARVARSRGTVRISSLEFAPGEIEWAPPEFGDAAPQIEFAVGRLDERKLRDPRAARIVVRGERSNVVHLAGDISGRLVQDVRWTLTLRRVR